jgi:hypothetical protein
MVAFHLGVALHAGGVPTESKENLQNALALKLPSPYRNEAEALLEKMNRLPEASSEAQSKLQPPAANASTDDLNNLFNNMAPKMPGTDISTDDTNKDFNQMATGSMDIGLEDIKPEDLEKK